MNKVPKWFLPVAIIALIWNLLGCAAFLYDVMLTPDDVAKMTAAKQAMYAARPMWAVAASAVAVWFGALGCVGLILRKRWSHPLLILSLLGVIGQDIGLFIISKVRPESMVFALQGAVLLISIGLVLLSRKGIRQQWFS